MAAISNSYFIFHLSVPDDPSPNPGPEWPPVEPSPIPPVTDPVPTVTPVTGIVLPFYAHMLN